VGTGKPIELLRLALIGAKMLERVTPDGDPNAHAQAFAVGLFSTIDAFLALPMVEALARISHHESATPS